jgi:pimeloyl-ACP methyl ester carboxylesterase
VRVRAFLASVYLVLLVALAPQAAAQSRALTPRPLTGPQQLSYDLPITVSGQAPVRLHVEELGRGPPLVFLHGLGGSGYSFRFLIGPLARHHRVILLDLKGFGASEKPFDTSYAPGDHARLVAAFLRQQRLNGVTLAGHSFGGSVALLTALELNRGEPGRIRQLILMNTPAFPQTLPRTQSFLTLPVLPYLALGLVPPILSTRAALKTTRRMTAEPTDIDAIAYAEPLYEPGGRHAMVATARAIAAFDGRLAIPLYRTLRQPTLLIWCRQDPTVPLASGERLASTLPQARLAVLEQCDHAPAEEQPRETLNLMQAFIGRR